MPSDLIEQLVAPDPSLMRSGQRCGAINSRGFRCNRYPLPGKRRCRWHGGLSTGPKTAEGKAIAARNGAKAARKMLGELHARGSPPGATAPLVATEASDGGQAPHTTETRKDASVGAGASIVGRSGLGDELVELTAMGLDHMRAVLAMPDKRAPKGTPAHRLGVRKDDLAKAVLRAQVASDQAAFMERRTSMLSEVIAALLEADKPSGDR